MQLECPLEMLAIVDEHDRIVGRAPRSEVHRRRLCHRAVHILLLNTRGDVFVQRRAEHKDCAPGLWDTSAAGHVEFGESYDEAAPRELSEELGINAPTLQPGWDIAAGADTGNEFVRVYLCTSDVEPRPDAKEIAASGWYSEAELRDWIRRRPDQFTDVFRLIFARYQTRCPTG